jgi:hypothetical protein
LGGDYALKRFFSAKRLQIRIFQFIFAEYILSLTQNYVISATITKKLAQSSEQEVRKAARLYFWLKTHNHSNSFDINALRPELLRSGFSYYHIKKYLSVLKKISWAGIDEHGKCFLRGRNMAVKIAGSVHRFSAMSVRPEFTRSAKAWSAFLAAAQIGQVAREFNSMLRDIEAKTKRRRAVGPCLPPCQDGVKTARQAAACPAPPTPLPHTLVASWLHVSKTTAHSMRKQAVEAGLIKVENRYIPCPKQLVSLYPSHFMAAKKKAARRYEEDEADGLPGFFMDRMVWKTRQPAIIDRFVITGTDLRENVSGWQQLPSLVTVTGIEHKMVTCSRTSKEIGALYLRGKIRRYKPGIGWQSPYYALPEGLES